MKLSKVIFLLIMTCFVINTINAKGFSSTESLKEQPVPKPIRKIVKEIAKANTFVLRDPAQASPLTNSLQENYLVLSKLATSGELENLIKTHKNAVVRLYAFKALTTQVHDIPDSIMSIINNDTSIIDSINRDKKEKKELKVLVQNFLN